MRYARLSEDGTTVLNTIICEPALMAELKWNVVPIGPEILCGPGDTVVDLKAKIFQSPETDPQVLADAKTEALTKIEAAASCLKRVQDGSLAAEIQAATNLQQVQTARSEAIFSSAPVAVEDWID